MDAVNPATGAIIHRYPKMSDRAVRDVVERVSDAYEGEVEGALATLTAVLEPALILVMGGIVLFIVLAILLPIFEINSLVK